MTSRPSGGAAAPPGRRAMLCGVCLAAFVVSMSSYTLLNDHFDRISRARQIAQYGDLPFRDFLDPGYFITEFTSAGLQLLLGDNLLGEMLLDCAFVAGGVTIVALLSLRLSQSLVASLAASLLSLLALPRAYDFDKVFFYPLGVLLCWRYLEAPVPRRRWTLAASVAVAALYRYDTGLFIAGAAMIGTMVLHAGDWRALAREGGRLAAAIACLSLPPLLFLQSTAGILDTADQVMTYARREGGGTRIASPPRLSLTDPVSMAAAPPRSQTVIIRWVAAHADDAARRELELRHALSDSAPRGEPGERTWSYRMNDVSPQRLRALLRDPAVEDTSGIERDLLQLTPEPWWVRAQRAVPVLRLRVLAGSWNADNANAFLYYALHVLPLLAVAMLVLNAGSLTPLPRVEVAKLSGLIVLCTVLNVFILRHPVGARIGGIAGPAAVLATWLWHHVWSMRSSLWGRTAKTVGVMALLLTAWSVSASADWQGRLASATVSPSEWVTSASALAASPPDPAIVGGRELTNMVRYLRECTGPRDRILVTWFAPEVYFFAQRGFAAGLATLASGHWSEERFQQRSVESLESRPAALVIHRSRDRDFTEQYPLLSNYLRQHYHDVGTTDFSGESSSGGSFVVLVHNDRANSMIHGPTSLPCFP